jgi:hypothetical protein
MPSPRSRPSWVKASSWLQRRATGVRALDLRKGKQRTRFGSAAYVTSVQIDAAAHSVTLALENWCNRPYKETWTYAALGARLENTSAYQLHKKANYKLAALGFARAVALDPTWNIPAYNLASAQKSEPRQPDSSQDALSEGAVLHELRWHGQRLQVAW